MVTRIVLWCGAPFKANMSQKAWAKSAFCICFGPNQILVFCFFNQITNMVIPIVKRKELKWKIQHDLPIKTNTSKCCWIRTNKLSGLDPKSWIKMNKYSDFVIGERQILKNVLNDSEMTINCHYLTSCGF